jgi:hypothetical protein
MLGQTLDSRYTITARLGKGAMGAVYRALDKQTEQEVAVKVIARELALDVAMLERFRREGEALRQLRHPNIVGFVDMFEFEEQHVIVMEYVPGGNLHQLLKQGPLPLDRCRRVALELCDALTRAHYLNIIHRDLKPENVMLAADGTPKLTDFGVARLISEGTRLTGTGTQVGTPFYMSPEAWEGKPLDAQTDIWSLGIMLYEMLSGQVPFSGDTIVAVMHQVLNAPLPDLSTLRPDVPPGLAQIVHRMLARDKAERYQSMRELGADLERGEPLTLIPGKARSAAAKPTRAKAPPTVARAAKGQPAAPAPSQRFPWWLVGAGALGVLALVVAAAGLGGWWLASHPALTATLTPGASPPAGSGSLSARPACGAGETELFYDDFEHGAAGGWAFQDAAGGPAAAWPVVADGANRVMEATGHLWAVRPGGDNVALQVRVRHVTGDAVTHLNVRMGAGTRYWLGYSTAGSLMRDPPPDHTLAQFALSSDSAWHTVRLAAAGHHLEVRIDSQVVAGVDDAEGPVAGGIGLENTGGTLWYDDVLVCQLPAAAPPAAAAQVTYPADRFGTALFLDGQTGHAEIPYSDSLNLASALTLEGWFNFPRSPAGSCIWELCGLQVLLSQGHARSAAGNYTLAVYDRGLVFAFESVDTKLVAPAPGLNYGWHHVAVTHRFGAEHDSRFYLDGEPLTTTSWTNDSGQPTSGAALVGGNSRSPYYLGFNATAKQYTAGWLDEIRVWNVVRSQAEIRANLGARLTGREPGLVAYWNFDEPAGATTARDSSQSANTAQLRGGAELRAPPASAQPDAPTLVNLQYPDGCTPNPAPASLVVFAYGVGGGSPNVDAALQAVGHDTYGAIWVNGQAVAPATAAMIGQALDAHGRALNPNCDNTQCGFITFAGLRLEPGQYDVRAAWPRADGNPDPRSCTLNVVAR